MAGDDLTNDIVEYMRRQHNIRVSERMAERIKINVGSALSILEDAPEDFEVCGPNQNDGSADESACFLPGNRTLFGQVDFKD